MNSHELAWAAGFFDGEGSVVQSTAKWNGVKGTYLYPTIRLSIVQCGEHAVSLLSRFQDAVGGLGKIIPVKSPSATRKPHWKARYDLKLQGFEACQAAIAMLWPWLGPQKKADAIRSLNVIKNHYETYVSPHPSGPAGHIVKG